MIEEVLTKNEKASGIYSYWLADSYDNLPKEESDEGTECPVDPTWRSPFIGKPIEDLVEFLRKVPPDRGINKYHFMVLDKKQYEEKGWLKVYKRYRKEPNIGRLTSLPGNVTELVSFTDGYDNDTWDTYLEEWHKYGLPVIKMSDQEVEDRDWEDGCIYMLFCLEDIPTSVITRFLSFIHN